MAIADVTYHPHDGRSYDSLGNLFQPQEGDSDQLDFTSGTDEGAVQASATIARVNVDADCRVAVLSTGTATTANSAKMNASTTEAFVIPEGHFLSVMAA